MMAEDGIELIDQLLGRLGSVLTVDVEKTPFGNENPQREYQRGMEKGIEKGIERGFLEGEQASIRLYLESRFPALAGASIWNRRCRRSAGLLTQALDAIRRGQLSFSGVAGVGKVRVD